jgi:hypothetical protein
VPHPARRLFLLCALLALLAPAWAAARVTTTLDGALHAAAADGRTVTAAESTLTLVGDRFNLAYGRRIGHGAGRHRGNTYDDDGWRVAARLCVRPQTGRVPRLEVGYTREGDTVRLAVRQTTLTLDAAPILTTDTVDVHASYALGRATVAAGAGAGRLALFDHEDATIYVVDGSGTLALSRRWTLRGTLCAVHDDHGDGHTAGAGTLRATWAITPHGTLVVGGTLCAGGVPLVGTPVSPMAAGVVVLGLDGAVADFHRSTLGLLTLGAHVAW